MSVVLPGKRAPQLRTGAVQTRADRADRVVDPSGTVAADYTYDANGRVTRFADRDGKAVSLTYDANGDVAKVTTPRQAGAVDTVFTYDSDTQTTETDPNGNKVVYTFDDDSRQISAKDALGHTQSRTWTASSDVQSTTDGLNNSSTSTYDSLNNLISTKLPTGATNTVGYTNAQHPSSLCLQPVRPHQQHRPHRRRHGIQHRSRHRWTHRRGDRRRVGRGMRRDSRCRLHRGRRGHGRSDERRGSRTGLEDRGRQPSRGQRRRPERDRHRRPRRRRTFRERTQGAILSPMTEPARRRVLYLIAVPLIIALAVVGYAVSDKTSWPLISAGVLAGVVIAAALQNRSARRQKDS